jgi:diguanylate cyclase (GGDEF)-like protein
MSPEAYSDAPRSRSPTILIIDDTPINIQVLNECLRGSYHILFSTDGREGIRIAAEQSPDLILLDIMMPDMDGYEVLKALKREPELARIPVIFVSAMGEDEHEELGLDLGAVDYIVKPFNPAIVRLRVRNQLELKRQRDILDRLSYLDGLTGVPNRRAFDEALEREWKRAVRSGKPLSLAMCDIDFFKNYNDACGHIAGDGCLRAVARALALSVERSTDFVGRYGGEEFAILLPETEAEGAAAIAREARLAVETLGLTHPSSAASPVITVSLGAATIVPDLGGLPRRLIELADAALYEAKAGGRNRVVAGRT